MAVTLTQSLKRLYEQAKITKEQVAERVKTGKISEDDFRRITGDDYEEEA